MEKIILEAKPREAVGKTSTRQLRREELIPAIVYGHGMKPLPLAVGDRDFLKILHTKAGENAVINLKVKGVKLKESTCLIKAIQLNPVTDRINHVDFTVISMTEKIIVKVPLHTLHAELAPGVKEGGVLDVIHHEIEVECLPTQIPEKFQIDLKEMKIGDTIHMKDIEVPEDVTCKLEPEETMVALHPPRKEEEPVSDEEGIQEPEVIEKGKKVAEGEEGEAAAAPGAKPAAKPAGKPEAKEAKKEAKPEKKE